MLSRCEKGVTFADGNLNQSFGIVLDYDHASNNSLANMLEKPNASICKDISDAKLPEENILFNGGAPQSGGPKSSINYSSFVKEVRMPTPINELVLSQASFNSRNVFFGGDYGRDDQFLTPIGELPGVAIHAAQYVSQISPVASLQALELFGDLALGYLFSIVIAHYWKVYFKLKKCDQDESASTLLLVFFFVYLSLTLVFIAGSVKLFQQGILIAPVMMALMLLIDAFMKDSLEAANEAIQTRDKACNQTSVLKEFKLTFLGSVAFVLMIAWLFQFSQDILVCVACLMAILGAYHLLKDLNNLRLKLCGGYHHLSSMELKKWIMAKLDLLRNIFPRIDKKNKILSLIDITYQVIRAFVVVVRRAAVWAVIFLGIYFSI